MKTVYGILIGVFLSVAGINAVALTESKPGKILEGAVDSKICPSLPEQPKPAASAGKNSRHPVQPLTMSVICANSNIGDSLGKPRSDSEKSETEKIEFSKILPKSASFLAEIKWPLTLLILALFFSLFLGRDVLRSIFSNLRGITGAGFSIEFNAEGRKKTLGTVSGTLGDFIKATNDAYSKNAKIYQVKELMEAVLKEMLPLKKDEKREYRATVHVPDVVYEDYTYQLLDYFPRNGEGGIARRFSQRRGILGKAWRLDKSIGAGNVIDFDHPNPALSEGETDQVLVSEWSMTNEELENWRQRKRLSFICILLRLPHGNSTRHADTLGGCKVGVLYVDSSLPDAFGNNEDASKSAEKLENSLPVVALSQAVADVMFEMRKNELSLKI